MTDRATSSAALARHATKTAIAAITIDATYTAVFWLILGRPHVAWKYFLIVGQLSVETVAVVHLVGRLHHVEEVTTA